MNTQITPRIAAEINLDGSANREANLLIGAIRRFAHSVSTAAVVAAARRKFPALAPAEATSKLSALVGDEIALVNYIGQVLRDQYDLFATEHKPALAAAVQARHDHSSRAAQLKAQIDNASRRHAEKVEGLRTVLTAGELSLIQPPNIDSLSTELVEVEEKNAELDEYISSSGLKPLPSFVVVSEPIRVSSNEAV